MESERLLALQHGKCNGCMATLNYDRTINLISAWKWVRQHRYYVLKMSVNGLSMTSGLAAWKRQGLCGNIDP
jgi:hypothetical protein